ncbi:MAG: hypothetical protein ABIZ80_08055 [Bryobacteraceae bacterium]
MVSRRGLLLGSATALPALAARRKKKDDEFDGWPGNSLRATGRFRIARSRSAYWLVTPAGHPLIVTGLCHTQMPPPELRVREDRTAEKFGNDSQRYSADVVSWMRNAGFNTFSYGVPTGGESAMNRFAELNLAPGFINGPQFPDLFDPGWRASAAAKIASTVPIAAKDTRVIGYVLSNPLLFSPHMERPAIWRDGQVKRQNYLMALKALPDHAPGKRAYQEYLRRTGRQGWVPATVSREYETLNPDDARFYTEMWSDLTAFLVREIRKHDEDGIIFSYRFIRPMRWPDPWLDAMIRGVGPHVDALAAELYADNAYREIVDGIGAATGKPTVVLDGMREREFIFADEANDEREAQSYREMYQSLTASPWFLGGCICEYRQKLPNNPNYSPRPKEGRMGVRNADYTDRPALLAAFRDLHSRKYLLREELLKRDRH